MKRVYKYGTGDEIPEGAKYLSTQVEEKINWTLIPDSGNNGSFDDMMRDAPRIRLVWHYFLVEVKE